MTDVLIIHYNTPELIEACIRSLWKNTPEARVTVFDNSDKRPFPSGSEWSAVRVLDNTRGQIVDWQPWLDKFPDKIPCGNDYGSAKHCYSVDVCMNMFPDGFVLMDSDVLVRRDIAPIVDRRYPWVGSTHSNVLKHFGFNVWRVKPFLCFINTPMLQQYGVRYFDPERMWGLHNDGYDTGAVLYTDCRSAGLVGKEVNIKEYILHLRNASWKERPAQEWLNENKALWE